MDQMFLFDTADIPQKAEPWRLHSFNDIDDTGAEITPMPNPANTTQDAA